MSSDDYYAVLGIERRAGPDEVKKAFRRLTLESHPDRHPDDPDAAERYRRVNEAYNILSDGDRRRRYDMSQRLEGLELRRTPGGASARDLLDTVFGDVFGTRRQKRRTGRDLRYTLTVSFIDAIRGSRQSIEFEALGSCDRCEGVGTRPGGAKPEVCTLCDGKGEVKGDGLLSRRSVCGRCHGLGMRQTDPCSACRGRGTRRRTRSFDVRLPPGTTAGAERVLAGQGEPGRFGGAAGDLRVTINVDPDPWLRRRGDEIHCDAFLSLTEAALGAKVPVPTVDGLVEVDVPPGVRSGTKLRLRGRGIPARGKSRGDQLVTVVIETPVVSGAPDVVDALERLDKACARSEEVLPQRWAQREAMTEPSE